MKTDPFILTPDSFTEGGEKSRGKNAMYGEKYSDILTNLSYYFSCGVNVLHSCSFRQKKIDLGYRV
jgi:hypothetical protein